MKIRITWSRTYNVIGCEDGFKIGRVLIGLERFNYGVKSDWLSYLFIKYCNSKKIWGQGPIFV